jgi:hypothetical protein
MLAAGTEHGFQTFIMTVEPRRFIRSGIAASVVAHLSILTMVLIFTEVHPFGSVTAEPITVDIVSPDEAGQVPEKTDPPPEPKEQAFDALDRASKSAASTSPTPAVPQEAAAPLQQQVALPNQQQPGAQPPPSTSPAYTPPEPDLSLKYHVMLGLPPELPQGLPQDRPGDGFDAPASKTADIGSNPVTQFRIHLKTCSKLPASVRRSDKIKITLRVFMTPEGKLAAAPVLIEASASAKGPALMQSAISALAACQPYAMLPVDRYGEWKVLDLSFTPQDFADAS